MQYPGVAVLGGGVVAFREKSTGFESVITDHEFESLLRRTSTIFKERKSRLLKFPDKTELKRLARLRDR